MEKRDIITILSIIIVIYFIGFIPRIISTDLLGISNSDNSYFQDEHGLPYMYEIDSYYNYRLADNYLNNGIMGDIILNGKEWDLKSYYPPGRVVDYPPLIVFLVIFIYQIVNLVSATPLIIICFWIPAFIAPISGIIAYLIVRKFTNDWGALSAGILTVLSPFYFVRTVPGWFDTDFFTVFFPLLITYLLFEAVLTDNKRKSILFSSLAAISILTFAFSWKGWFFMLCIIFFAFLTYIIAQKFMNEKINNIYYIFIILLISVPLFLIFKGISILDFIPFNFLNIFDNSSAWPSIYSSVSELKKFSILKIISLIGITLFVSGLIGMILLFINFIHKNLLTKFLRNMNLFIYLLLLIWIAMAAYFITMGNRFILMIIPPLIISAGIFIGLFVDCLYNLKNNEKLGKILSIFFIFIIILPPIIDPYGNLVLDPFLNDDLVDAANWIRSNTTLDTVVISEWSYGYFFPVYANRAVTIDGGSQNSPREYWVCRAFCVGDDLSGGIFRMLSSSGDEAWLVLDGYTGNTSKSVEVLNSVLGLDRDEALVVLQGDYGFSLVESERILSFTHPSSPNPFVVVTTDRMLDSGYWNFYYGEWDFNKGVGGNFTYSVGDLFVDKKFVNSSNGFVWDKGNDEVFWNGLEPYCLVVVDDGVVNKRYLNNSSDFCVFMVMDWDKCVVVDKRFENSVFTKLVIERVNTSNFKIKYKNKKVTIWEFKK
ncbi:MAG: hypothetical protein CIT01_08560 [Methanobacterium sp. BRmetb2]|nr:MAG: hypothetical protein CIT01_08560 [Methanobacterium sp. BRmetb2]